MEDTGDISLETIVFKACPALFYQTSTIHAVVIDQTFPLVFFFLKNKSEQQNIRVSKKLEENNSGLEPSYIVLDFEKASISSFLRVFSGVTIKGCFFHFAQANCRNIQEIELAPV